MKDCAEKANKCKTKESEGQKAAGDAIKVGGENAQRAAEAAKMGEQCNKSKENEDKMPSMPQMPQMPQQKDDQSPQSNPYESTVASDTASSIDTDTTVKTDVVKFGESKLNNDIDMIPTAETSVISGNTPGGPVGGLGARGGPLGYGSGSGGDVTKSGGSATSKGGIGSGASSLGSSDSSKPKDGIAGADIKPESGNSFEVPTGSGGKSVLGLKSGSGSDDEVTVDKLAGNVGKGGAGDAKKGGPGTAGSSKGSAAGVEGGLSLFDMVKTRYRELRKIGEI